MFLCNEIVVMETKMMPSNQKRKPKISFSHPISAWNYSWCPSTLLSHSILHCCVSLSFPASSLFISSIRSASLETAYFHCLTVSVKTQCALSRSQNVHQRGRDGLQLLQKDLLNVRNVLCRFNTSSNSCIWKHWPFFLFFYILAISLKF